MPDADSSHESRHTGRLEKTPQGSLQLIGESGGVSETIWKLILGSAAGRTGPQAYIGVKPIPNNPVHQHVTAEGIE